MSEHHDKILMGLEKLANTEGYPLEIVATRDQNGAWLLMFKAGKAQVYTRMSSFARVPQIVLEPFGEELIKQMKGLL